jgi:acetyl-CoA carboxylase biotin carboxyl carrier protein
MLATRHLSREWEILKWIAIAALAAALALMWAGHSVGKPDPQPAVPVTVDVVSPWDGTFHAGDYPGAVPYVRVGSVVNAQSIVATVDASMTPMGLRAMVEGTVIEVFVVDGEMVTAGQRLVRIQLAPQPTIGR